MRAVQIRTFGEPGIVLELADLPAPPALAAAEVLIGVEHAPVNMNDLYLIQGVYPVRPSLPSVVGNEGVGECWPLEGASTTDYGWIELEATMRGPGRHPVYRAALPGE